jgi:hypothetical protein
MIMAAAAMPVGAAAVRDPNKSDGCDYICEGEVKWVEEVSKHTSKAHDRWCRRRLGTITVWVSC